MAFLLLIPLLLATGDPHYLFYLHGQIVEGTDGRPTHPEYGVYDQPAIVEAFEAAGFTVLAEIRPAGGDGFADAERVVARVDSLLSSGVPASDISVVGMSKGGGIALAAASRLQNPDLNFVFLATCVSWNRDLPTLTLPGRVLSIFEATDEVAGSCRTALAESHVGPPFRELRLSTGLGHGAFYRPDPSWIDPVVAWCRGEDAATGEEVRRRYARYGDGPEAVPAIPADSLAAWMETSDVVLVDVREEHERAVSTIPGALTRGQFELDSLQDQRTVAYCTIGYRSGAWVAQLRARGVDAFNLEGGILGWVHAWYPVLRDGVQVREVAVPDDEWDLLPSWYQAVR